MVEATGLEPAASCSQSRHSTKLSYASNCLAIIHFKLIIVKTFVVLIYPSHKNGNLIEIAVIFFYIILRFANTQIKTESDYRNSKKHRKGRHISTC